MNVSIIGTGYVGLVTGVALAHAGHRVVCVGRNSDKVASINAGKAPFFETGLEVLLRRVIAQRRFTATVDFARGVADSHVTIIAVGTPTIDGAIDLSQIKEAARLVGEALSKKRSYHVVAVKSTVVPGTTESVVWPILANASGKSAKSLGLCMNPEFLREGNAMEDALDPDRIVIGSSDSKSAQAYAKLFSKNTCPVFFTNLPTAEMSKYVSNIVLATLVSFSNEMGRLAAQTRGVDVVDVWRTVHADRRWSPKIRGKRITPGIIHYLYTGCGYGGSCFPKDTKALYHFALQKGVSMSMLGSTIAINDQQPHRLVELVLHALGELHGKRVAVLGLTFKPNTDDIRESPSIAVVRELVDCGADVVCHDPQAYKAEEPEALRGLRVRFVKDYASALTDADAAVLATAWDIYRKIPPQDFVRLMRKPIVVDGRRVYDPSKFTRAGVQYLAVGCASEL